MKRFIGKEVEFVVEQIGAFRAKVVGEQKTRVLVQGKNDQFPRRIIKSKIISFMPLEATEDDVNLLVLTCENPTIGCNGVQYVHEGEGFKQSDFKRFMMPCSSRCETCRSGSFGELRTMEGSKLREMMAGTMFGEYPEEPKIEE